MARQLDLWGDETPDSAKQSKAPDSRQQSDVSESQSSTNESVRQLLTNPDRQFTFAGASHDDWPDPAHDRDAITVDRLRDDIDGPAHRFVVKRYDLVEVFFSKDKVDYGTVVGISHARKEVRVLFDGGDEGVWFPVGCIYPAVPEAPSQAKTKSERTSKRRSDEINETCNPGADVELPIQRISSHREYTSLKCVSLVRIGSMNGRPRITSTQEAISFFKRYWEQCPGTDQERFVIACVDTKHAVQSVVEITVGTLDASLVHPREVFRPALIESSSAILLSHNHPSGDPTPSREDRQVTERLTEAGKLLGIQVLDHIIHGDGTGETVSIRES